MATKTDTIAQLYDQLLNRTTFSLFLLSIALGVDCAEYFLAEDMHDTLKWIRRGFTLVILVSLGPVMLRGMKLKVFNRSICLEPEGFLQNIYQKACTHGFTFLILLLVGLQAYLGPETQELPTEFYIKLVLGASLLVVSASFFIQTRVDDELEDDLDDVEHDA